MLEIEHPLRGKNLTALQQHLSRSSGQPTHRIQLLEHPHSLALPTPKSGEIFVRIGGKFGLGSAEVPAVPPAGHPIRWRGGVVVASGERESFGTENVGEKEETRGRGRLVLLHPESPRDPGKPRMARGVRTKLGRFSDENEDLEARLCRFSPSGYKKRLVGGFSGRRVEML